MSRPLQITDQPWGETYSEIIDVRSPSEFAEDHWPGSVNLPVLNDSERAEVGWLYKQVDPLTARKRGATFVAANIAHHLNQHFVDKDRHYRPLIYCWRGGQRSRSLALVLAEVGWCVSLLQGGYKTYRAWVREQLKTLPGRFHYRLLCGSTGSGKTLILRRLAVQGSQVLDLEGLACHRGSLLGEEWRIPQPSQKWFETQLCQALQQMDPQRPVWLEAESCKVGQLYIPPALWQAMLQAPALEIQTPLPERIKGLIQDYPHWIAQPEWLKAKLILLKPRYGQAQITLWLDWIDQQNWYCLVEDLLKVHYDPSYYHALERSFRPSSERIVLADFSEGSLQQAVQKLQHWQGIPLPRPVNPA
ncbi:MAG: tRNA 2-selenouridine(34) synthase MnmH [Cyanobacteriota bacterium]|nr:tRNA 2-selenouridine(34) synthase MnmH [Cyanobacteriota bacterium]